jgi:hypothetical protein
MLIRCQRGPWHPLQDLLGNRTEAAAMFLPLGLTRPISADDAAAFLGAAKVQPAVLSDNRVVRPHVSDEIAPPRRSRGDGNDFESRFLQAFEAR